MKNYYRLEAYSTSEDMGIKDIKWDRDKLKYHVDGLKIDIINSPEIIFEKVKLNQKDYFADAYLLPLVSSSIKKILEKSECDLPYLQFIPVKSNVQKDYYALIILENIYCFNWDESEYTRFPEFLANSKDMPNKIHKLKFVKEKIGYRNIFRMAEQSSHIFISDVLSNILIENKITGMKITKSPNMGQMYDDE